MEMKSKRKVLTQAGSTSKTLMVFSWLTPMGARSLLLWNISETSKLMQVALPKSNSILRNQKSAPASTKLSVALASKTSSKLHPVLYRLNIIINLVAPCPTSEMICALASTLEAPIPWVVGLGFAMPREEGWKEGWKEGMKERKLF